MKTCPSCHNEYEDTSDICPKCGAFYQKKFKFPSIFKLIFYFYVYGIGVLVFLASIISIKEDFITSLYGFLFSLSLIKPIYTFFFNKFNLNKKLMFILRIILPLILISIIFSRVIYEEESRDRLRERNIIESQI